MEIVFISAEIAPIYGVGVSAQVCGSLPKALRGLDHQVACIAPLYQSIDPEKHSLARRLTSLSFSLKGTDEICQFYQGRSSGGIELNFVGHDSLATCNSFAGSDDPETALQAGRFARAAVEVILQRDTPADVIVVHGWVGAVALHAIKEVPSLAKVPVFLNVYKSTWRTFSASCAEILCTPEQDAIVDPVSSALPLAAKVIVNSTSLATAVQECDNSAQIAIIANGCDAAHWNPVTDPHLPTRFDALEPSGKATCRVELQRELGLPVRDDIPLIATWGNETPDDGLDRFVEILPSLLRNDIQVAVAHTKNAELAASFNTLVTEFPERIQVCECEPNGPAVHRLLGASDLVVIPRRTSIGSEHLYAHGYGAVPVAPQAGTYQDTLIDCDSSLESGTGFLFDNKSDGSNESLLGGVQRGIAAFASGETFETLRERVMRLDHSWERSGRLYDRLFREVLRPGETENIAALGVA